jgi:NTE family protein
MMVQNRKVHTAVVLQGGGALGAYEYGILRALYEQRPGFRPAAVAGISIGAVTAAVLAGAKTDPIAALDRLWREEFVVSPPRPIDRLVPARIERHLAVLGNPGMYRTNPALFTTPWTAMSLYDTTPLRRILTELVEPDKLNGEEPQAIVGAINVGTGEMEYFDRHRPGGLTFDHVIASGSLPPGFPMTEIGGQRYWDGGLFSNLPLAPAINALQQAGDGDRSAIRELIVVELFPMSAPLPHTMSEVLQRMVQLQYTSRLTLDKPYFEEIERFVDLMAKVDKQLPKRSEVRRDPTYQALLASRKIDRFSVVTSTLPSELSHASDFSRSTIEARIQAGHDDAIAQGIGHVDVETPSPDHRRSTVVRRWVKQRWGSSRTA